jgi:hypothetical protein
MLQSSPSSYLTLSHFEINLLLSASWHLIFSNYLNHYFRSMFVVGSAHPRLL